MKVRVPEARPGEIRAREGSTSEIRTIELGAREVPPIESATLEKRLHSDESPLRVAQDDKLHRVHPRQELTSPRDRLNLCRLSPRVPQQDYVFGPILNSNGALEQFSGETLDLASPGGTGVIIHGVLGEVGIDEREPQAAEEVAALGFSCRLEQERCLLGIRERGSRTFEEANGGVGFGKGDGEQDLVGD